MTEPRTPHIAIDFDGVIHDFLNPTEGRVMGPPIPGAKEAISHFLSLGWDITIFTCRGDNRAHIASWLVYYRFPFLPISFEKPQADVYLDDKGLRFDNWPAAIEEITRIAKEIK